jgi:hypothetical protein
VRNVSYIKMAVCYNLSMSKKELKMDLEKLETTSDIVDIAGIFNKLQHEGSEITLWQSKDNQRVVVKARIISLNPKDKSFVVKADEGSYLEFDKDLSIYFHAGDYSFLFKKKVSDLKDSVIEVPLPDEMKILNYRESERFRFTKRNVKKAILRLKSKTKSEGINLSFDLIDISETGLGLAIKSIHYSKLKFCTYVQLQSLGAREFPPPISAEVVHLIPCGKDEQGRTVYKMGLRLEVKIPKRIIRDLLDC